MKMNESKFKFTTPFLVSLNFRINTKNVEKSTFNLEYNISSEFIQEEKRAFVLLTLDINHFFEEFNEEELYKIKLKIAAEFTWDDSYIEENIKKFLNINAPALLLSYARPIVANLTMQSGLEPYHIPFINFTDKSD